jgi:tetratricopeptide (TPR) repeat protein
VKPKERILAALTVIALPLGAYSVWEVRQFQQGQQWLTKADQFEHAGQSKEAVLAYQKALGYYPYFTEATLELADLLEEQERLSEAEATLTRAIQVSSGASVAVLYRQRGLLRLRQEQFEEADRDFVACLKLDSREGLALQGQKSAREYLEFLRQGVKSPQLAVLGDSWAAGTPKLAGIAPRLAPLLPKGWSLLDLSLRDCSSANWEKAVATAIERKAGLAVLWRGQDELAQLCAQPPNPQEELRRIKEFAQSYEWAAKSLQQAGCHGWVGLLDVPRVKGAASTRARQLTDAYNQELREICSRYHLRGLEPVTADLPLVDGHLDESGYAIATKWWSKRLRPWIGLKGLGAASAKPD